MSVLRMGSKGEEVKRVQAMLNKLGFSLQEDGVFGQNTQNATITMQTIFAYDVDAMVGPATEKLLTQQLGYGWHLEAARKAFVKPA